MNAKSEAEKAKNALEAAVKDAEAAIKAKEAAASAAANVTAEAEYIIDAVEQGETQEGTFQIAEAQLIKNLTPQK